MKREELAKIARAWLKERLEPESMEDAMSSGKRHKDCINSDLSHPEESAPVETSTCSKVNI